jgi:hypothetical protein
MTRKMKDGLCSFVLILLASCTGVVTDTTPPGTRVEDLRRTLPACLQGDPTAGCDDGSVCLQPREPGELGVCVEAGRVAELIACRHSGQCVAGELCHV